MRVPVPRIADYPFKSQATLTLLTVSVVLSVATIIVILERSRARADAENLVAHTHLVIETSHGFLNSLGAAESFHFTYLLTKDTARLVAHFSARDRIDTLARKMRSLTLDNPDQTKRLDKRIFGFKNSQFLLWDDRLKNVDHPDPPSLVGLTAPGRNSILDSLYQSTLAFIGAEEELVKKRQDLLAKVNLINNIIATSFLLVICSVVIMARLTIRSQKKQIEELVTDIQQSNQNLEHDISKRTNELEVSNKELRESIEEIKTLKDSLSHRAKLQEDIISEMEVLYDDAPCGYHTVDASGKIAKMNKTELKWLGYAREEVIGEPISKFLSVTSMEARKTGMNTLQEVGHIEGVEVEFLKKDGTILLASLNSIAHFDPNGKLIMHRSTIFEIGERIELERRLKKANAHLKKLNEQKDQFLGIATHDLKNPLNAIHGLIKLIGMSGNDIEKHQEYLGYMEKSVMRMNTLISNLLDLNRIERNGLALQVESVDIKKLLTEAEMLYAEIARTKQIKMIFEHYSDAVHFNTDRALLSQVIDNLLSNAIKFSPRGSSIWIRSSVKGNAAEIEFQDQGPGISSDEMPKLFRPFQRLTAQPTGGESSSGLGLSIVKGIVTSLGGDIAVNSRVGRGTSFLVRIVSSQND